MKIEGGSRDDVGGSAGPRTLEGGGSPSREAASPAELVELYRPRVARGIQLLDEAVEGWRDRISLLTLTMSDCKVCVLGQVYGWYFDGRRRLGLATDEEAQECGFNISLHHTAVTADALDEDERLHYTALTEAWRAELETPRCP